ncbi:MAG: hypothetical protein KFF73_08335 [Cyclobacteriaceae bacterium]|nr:hypothetical protein [Cyclobacteriaceae bacterium]
MKNVISRFVVGLIFMVLGFGACNYPGKPENSTNREKLPDLSGKIDPDRPLPPAIQSYRLWHTTDQFDLRSFNYHGGFFDERLKFFYLKNPGLRMVDADVDLIMLYFLDDRLVKIRYHLARDVTDPILDSLGLGILETRYNLRKTVLATDKSIKRLKDYNREKGKQDEYNIVWDRKIIDSSYHVDPNPSSIYTFDTIRANFVYVDQLKSYRKNLIELENELRQKLMLSAEK